MRSQTHPLQHEGKSQTLSTLRKRDYRFRKAAFGSNRTSPLLAFPFSLHHRDSRVISAKELAEMCLLDFVCQKMDLVLISQSIFIDYKF